MPYVERTDEEIIAAWEEWSKRLKNPDKKIIWFGERNLSIRDVITGMRAGDQDCLNLGIGCARRLAKTMDHDPVEEITRQ
jgi:hypothetical protein